MAIGVLLVDDHAIVRAGLRLLLSAQPQIAVVGEAATGYDAVRLSQLLQPDVVLMDIAMVDLNGIEATRQIRALRPATNVVILSMHSSEEYIARAFQAGAQGYLLKESVASNMVDAVLTVHAGRRYLCRKLAETGLYDRYYLGDQSFRANETPLARLSDRELEVLQLIAEGRSNAQIAVMLALSPKTIETYRSRLMQKLGLSDLPSLVKFAIRHGLTSLE